MTGKTTMENRRFIGAALEVLAAPAEMSESFPPRVTVNTNEKDESEQE
jgi:hypothetical protein